MSGPSGPNGLPAYSTGTLAPGGHDDLSNLPKLPPGYNPMSANVNFSTIPNQVPGAATNGASQFSVGDIPSAVLSGAETAGKYIYDSLGGLKGLGMDFASWLTKDGGKNALIVAQGVNSVLNQQKASGYANDAVKSVNDSYNSRAPLRAKGIAELLNPTTPSLAGLNKTMTTGSPYASPLPVSSAYSPSTGLPTGENPNGLNIPGTNIPRTLDNPGPLYVPGPSQTPGDATGGQGLTPAQLLQQRTIPKPTGKAF